VHDLVEDRRLPDGTPLRIRPIAPGDRHRHWRFVSSLSLQTRYHRLMSARCLLPDELRRMVEIDYQRELALVAVAQIAGDEHELGVARFVREDAEHAEHDRQPRLGEVAEFAIVVADAWQHRGVGHQLLRSLKNAAAAAGVRQLSGLTLATNGRMIGLARRHGFEVSSEPGDWTVRRITWRQPVDFAAESGAAGSGAAESDAAESDAAESDAAESGAAGSSAAGSSAAGSSAAGFIVAQ
jgi:GNAT superfamily N-acetyltransferase